MFSHVTDTLYNNLKTSLNKSLYTGTGGLLLFKYASRKSDADFFDNEAEELVDLLLDDISENFHRNATFCSGISGNIWLINYLSRKKWIKLEEGMFDEVYYPLFNLAKKDLYKRNYDFLHGASGMIFSLLSEPDRNREYLIELTQDLLNIRDTYRGYNVWTYPLNNPTETSFDVSLGLSHGVPALMVLLSKLYQAGILPESCSQAIIECYDFMLHCKNEKPDEISYSFYPSRFTEGKPLIFQSRMAWCYGDLGIGAAYYTVGKIIGHTAMINEAIEIYNYYVTKKLDKQSGIMDTCFCHGAAGIVHLFNRMYHNTNDTKFKAAAGYWYYVSLNMTNLKDGGKGYMSYFGIDGWKTDMGLLNGLCGFALSLMSNGIDEAPDWDECFLLS